MRKKILKLTRGKQHITQRGKTTRTTLDFSPKTMRGVKQWGNILEFQRESYLPRIFIQ